MLNRLQAKDALRTALENVLEENVGEISDSMHMFEDFHMDSTTMLETLLELEDILGFNVDPEELNIDDFLTVSSYTDFLLKICNHAEEREILTT